MIPIKEFLNKIRWDKRLKTEEYTLLYIDRINKTLIEIPLRDITLEGEFMILHKVYQETSIPLP